LKRALTSVLIRIRGTIDQVDAKSMVVKDRAGKATPFVFADELRVTEVLPIDRVVTLRYKVARRRSTCRTASRS
jgi:hypothetical protein